MDNYTASFLKLGAIFVVLVVVAAVSESVQFFFWVVVIGGGLLYWVGTMRSRRHRRDNAKAQASIQAILAQYGATPVERAAGLNKAFDEKNGAIKYRVDEMGSNWVITAPIGRTLAAMTPREREALRAALLMHSEGVDRSLNNTRIHVRGLVWGDGKATYYEGAKASGSVSDKGIKDALNWLISDHGVEESVNSVLDELQCAVRDHPNNPVVRALGARLLSNGTDMAPSGALQPLTDITQTDNALIVGEDEHDASKLWTFKGEGSLITIAPPGSGKTQCHVIPNLLTWIGPAVVLDIKGEIHAATSAWRSANVGPVFKFSPLDPGSGHSYNPLLGVSDDPDHIWEDSRFLADMLIVPSGKSKDPFWESRARDVLNAAIADTVRNKVPEERSMGPVLDILHGVDWTRFIISLQAATEVPSMARMGRSLGDMETKMRDSVLQTALASLSAWEGARITRATQKSDWMPSDLRSGRNPTIYICIKPNEIDSYASMLRVIIAQHIRALTSTLPERGGASILFILDELPRLRHMPPVEEALEIGRQYGIKLWMFTQSLGQLETAYENAEGMAANCALRIFMNPSLHDGTAQKLSDDMGHRESIIDGTRQKRVEADVLAGADFTDKVIVMASGATPARLRKHFAYSDPELSARAATQSTLS